MEENSWQCLAAPFLKEGQSGKFRKDGNRKPGGEDAAPCLSVFPTLVSSLAYIETAHGPRFPLLLFLRSLSFSLYYWQLFVDPNRRARSSPPAAAVRCNLRGILSFYQDRCYSPLRFTRFIPRDKEARIRRRIRY